MEQLAEQNHALQERAVAEHEKREALLQELVELRRANGRLKAELTKQRQDHPKMVEAREVFDAWVKALGKNKRTAFDEARQKAVLARLAEPALSENGTRKDDLLKAIEGLRLMPFVGPHGRQGKAGPGAKRHDNLGLLCREAENIERFMGYVDEVRRQAIMESVPPRKPDHRPAIEKARSSVENTYGRDSVSGQVRWHNRSLEGVLGALEQRNCTTRGSGDRWTAQCPAHEDRDPSLAIREVADGAVLLHCFAGCETADVLSALGLEWWDIGPDENRSLTHPSLHEGWVA